MEIHLKNGGHMTALTIDLFCRVVDNFGDIGVCWRLARQLVRDEGCRVRLFVDDFASFQKIEHSLDLNAAHQMIAGVDILPWNDNIAYDRPSQAVIEAFACTLPDRVVDVMRQVPSTVWIDLEYLSAEDWIEDCHAIPSFHPATGLNKTLFFPGFTPRTGGLFRDRDLIARRNAFQSDSAAQDSWRAQHGIPPRAEGVIDISLFCYPDAPVEWLIEGLQATGRPHRIFAAATVPHEHPALNKIKFLNQEDYSRLLWTCDMNFVRGEDSFLQSVWAGKPMIWQIYPQDEDTHMIKLRAFLARYGAESLEKFMILWNERGRTDRDMALGVVSDCFASLDTLTAHARDWTDALAKQPDIASQIVRFIRQQQA